MNPGIVIGLGCALLPLVCVATSWGKKDKFDIVIATGIAWLFIVSGATFFFATTSKCGIGGSWGKNRWQWQGNTCVDTKAVTR